MKNGQRDFFNSLFGRFLVVTEITASAGIGVPKCFQIVGHIQPEDSTYITNIMARHIVVASHYIIRMRQNTFLCRVKSSAPCMIGKTTPQYCPCRKNIQQEIKPATKCNKQKNLNAMEEKGLISGSSSQSR